MERTEVQKLKSGLVMSLRHGRPDFACQFFDELIELGEGIWLQRYLPIFACSSKPSLLHDIAYRYDYNRFEKNSNQLSLLLSLMDWAKLAGICENRFDAFALHQLALWSEPSFRFQDSPFIELLQLARLYCRSPKLFKLLQETFISINWAENVEESLSLTSEHKRVVWFLFHHFERGSANHLELMACTTALIIRTHMGKEPVSFRNGDLVAGETIKNYSFCELDWNDIYLAFTKLLGNDTPELALNRLTSLYLHEKAFLHARGFFMDIWAEELESYFEMPREQILECIQAAHEILVN